MLIRCKGCGAALDADRVDLRRGIASCGFCKAVTRLDEPDDRSGSPNPHRERLKVPLPTRFKVDDEASRLTISWGWFTHAVIFLTFFCIVWDGFLVF